VSYLSEDAGMTFPTFEMAWKEEEEIAERGLIPYYLTELRDAVISAHGLTDLDNEIVFFLMLHASPHQRVKATTLAYIRADEERRKRFEDSRDRPVINQHRGSGTTK